MELIPGKPMDGILGKTVHDSKSSNRNTIILKQISFQRCVLNTRKFIFHGQLKIMVISRYVAVMQIGADKLTFSQHVFYTDLD